MKNPTEFETPSIFPNVLRSYEFPSPKVKGGKLQVLASTDNSDKGRLEHISVKGYTKTSFYTPCWDEMCYIKDAFFEAEQVVIQLHPKKSQHVNINENTLHLWRKEDGSYDIL
jgi:hypothetical protein